MALNLAAPPNGAPQGGDGSRAPGICEMLDSTIKISIFVLFAFLVIAEVAQKMTTTVALQRTPVAAVAPAPAPFGSVSRAPVPAAPAPVQAAAASALDEYRIAADAHGHFWTNALVNGQSLKVVVDTGATIVSIRNEDAAALGVYLQPADYTVPVSTANGAARMAPVKLREIQIGSILLYDVDALIGEPGALSANLLGMTFLSRLSRVEMDQGALLLHR